MLLDKWSESVVVNIKEEEETEMLSDGVAPVMDESEGGSDASVSESRDEETETNE